MGQFRRRHNDSDILTPPTSQINGLALQDAVYGASLNSLSSHIRPVARFFETYYQSRLAPIPKTVADGRAVRFNFFPGTVSVFLSPESGIEYPGPR